jgi:hypothetical protein
MRYLGEKLLFAVGQDAFETGGNNFSTLVPLATMQGRPVDRREFANRELVWWMVRGVPNIMNSGPGRLLVGTVEESMGGDRSNADSDLFQVNVETVSVAGPRQFIEVLTPNKNASMEPSSILNDARVILNYQPMTLVLVRLGSRIFGPFKSETLGGTTQDDQYSVTFQKARGDWPIYEIELEALPIRTLTAEVSVDGNPPSWAGDHKNCSYEVVAWDDFETARSSSKTIRLSSDEEVVGRVAKLVLSRSERQSLLRQFRGLMSGLSGAQTDIQTEDVERLKMISAELGASTVVVDDLVDAILKGGYLTHQIERQVSEVIEGEIAERAATIRAESEKISEDVLLEIETRRNELAILEEDIQRRRRQATSKLEKELSARELTAKKEINEQSQAVTKQQAELDRQRQVIEQNLSKVVSSFHEEKDKLIADFLAILPIFENAGVIATNSSVGANRSATPLSEIPESIPLLLPNSLSTEVDNAVAQSEEAFFNRFRKHVADCGFSYEFLDLLSFHVSIKCSDLSIVGGVSGTGKSSLPRLYSQALAGDDIEQVQRFLPIDVSPAWTNPSDLLGYVNLLDRSFHPSASGLFTHIAWAAMEAEIKKGDSGMYVICLDEMNLAQVEHYFSGFIQALSRAQGNREVSVFDQASVSPSDAAQIWARLPLGENIRFVGTVNFDETTKPISQRVLDRADSIGLQARKLLDIEGNASTSAAEASGVPIRVNDIRSWINDRPFQPIVVEFLEKLQGPLQSLGCALTPRRQAAIKRFLGSTPSSLCSIDIALDLQVTQRILPQIKGLYGQEARTALDQITKIMESHDFPFELSLRRAQEMQTAEELFEPAVWSDE